MVMARGRQIQRTPWLQSPVLVSFDPQNLECNKDWLVTRLALWRYLLSRARGVGPASSSSAPFGLLHLMRAVVASRILRTTIDLDATVVKELKRRSKIAGKRLGLLASGRLATSLRVR